jgi:hypothetical protein
VDHTTFYVWLLFCHFVGDFVFQSRYMAENKSTSFKVLAYHVAVYMIFVSFGACFAGWTWSLLGFILVNFGLHYLTDAVTSRITAYFWSVKNSKAFFTTIGFDQFIHAASLLVTARLFFGV